MLILDLPGMCSYREQTNRQMINHEKLIHAVS
jgi:hypothetical protein